jgi:hypothetical protein
LDNFIETCVELSRDQCSEDVFDAVIQLNRNKILGRLASGHFQRPWYERGPPRDPLTIRLKNHISSHCSILRSPQALKNLDLLSREADEFQLSFLQLERLTTEETIVDAIKVSVKKAFAITVDGLSLPARLRALSFTAPTIDGRDIREINKVANYWRVCRSLVHLSRAYRSLFATLRLETIEPYEPCTTSGKQRFVHAEIQMLVFYESSDCPRPRAIGASKEACFLCDAFIKAHGLFYLSKAHRRVFSQWTVPDRKDYGAATVERLSRALVVTNQCVVEAIERARHNRIFRRFPLQSSANINKLALPTPSVTDTSSTTKPNEYFTSSSGQPQRGTTQAVVTEHIGDCANNIPAAQNTEISFDSTSLITFTCKNYITFDWLHLHAELEHSTPHRSCTSVTHSSSKFPRASVRLESIENRDAVGLEIGREAFNVGDLAPGEERIIGASTAKEGECFIREGEVKFILTDKTRKPILVRCRWNRQL